jgi:hypothetical protein
MDKIPRRKNIVRAGLHAAPDVELLTVIGKEIIKTIPFNNRIAKFAIGQGWNPAPT